jgi:peptidyl-dipeptidase Dcp
MAEQRREVEAIAGSAGGESFADTIEALELSGHGLRQVASVFFSLAGAHTNDDIQAIERDIAPALARHRNWIWQNEAVFARIERLWERRDTLGLDAEQMRVLERYRTGFIRNGAALDADSRRRLGEITERLAALGTQFSQNVLADESSFRLVLESEDDLAGLPDFVRHAAARAAADHGLPGKHVITLSRSSIEPFLQFSERRTLRETAWRAWASRGETGGDTDNRAIAAEMVRLRAERARLLGYASFAHFRLDDTMAKTPEAALDLLSTVWRPARAQALREATALQALVQAEGGNFEVAPWDWRHYSEKRRIAEFDVSESDVKPYLQLDNIIEAAFYTANRLFGLHFAERHDVPVYHPDVRVWEVTGADGRHVGVFPRRLFRPADQAQRRLDGPASQPAEARRRHPPDRRQRDELLTRGRRRTGAALHGGRPHAVPRVRPRVARAPVQRDLSDDRRHQRGARLRRASLAALRALAGASRCCSASPCITGRASRCRRTCWSGCSPPRRSTRASPRSNTSRPPWPT